MTGDGDRGYEAKREGKLGERRDGRDGIEEKKHGNKKGGE